MKKFSIIITHYNQMKYIKEAILSVLKQDYKNIEVIVADDHSKEFDIETVKKIIEKNNKRNFEYKILCGRTNVGTVKNLNNALNKATGDYILFFAADDKLANNSVISNFVKEFEDDKKNIVTSQCGLYDHDLKIKYEDYVDKYKALSLNKTNAMTIYEKTCEGCFYGAGGTAYRRSVFEKYGNFNEKYIYVEDWSYWLYVTRNGEMIYYADFDSLCHRDGGISHSVYTPETIPNHIRQYYKDILNIYVEQVLPYIHNFTVKEKYRIMRQFNETILYYSSFVPSLISYLKDFDSARLNDKKLKYYWKYITAKKIFKEVFKVNLLSKIENLLLYNKTVPITIIFWIVICLTYINKLNISSNDLILLIYMLAYVVIYIMIYAIDKIANKLNLKFPFIFFTWIILNIITIKNDIIIFNNFYYTFLINYIISYLIICTFNKVLDVIKIYNKNNK